jgi:hypothetical protein
VNYTDAGALFTIYGAGNDNGLNTDDFELLVQDDLGGAVESGDAMGIALGSCDYNGDIKPDLSVGANGENVGTTADAGVVNVAYGAAGGLEDGSVQQWYQGHNGMGGDPEANDLLGSAIATCRW